MAHVQVNFDVPWCPHCRKMAPKWEAVMEHAHAAYPASDGRIRVGRVNCTAEQVCNLGPLPFASCISRSVPCSATLVMLPFACAALCCPQLRHCFAMLAITVACCG